MKQTAARTGLGTGVLTPWSGWPSIEWTSQRLGLALRERAARFPMARLATIAVWSALGIGVLVPVVLVALVTGPYRPMVVNTEAMAPELSVGDVIVNEIVRPGDLRAGDIVAYTDQMRDGAVVTERVVDVSRTGSTVTVTTAADASGRQASWSVDDATKVGRVAYRAPGLGRMLAVPNGYVGGALLAGLAGLLLLLAVRPWRRLR